MAVSARDSEKYYFLRGEDQTVKHGNRVTYVAFLNSLMPTEAHQLD